MNLNSPFSETRPSGLSTSYSKIGGSKKPRDIEDLRYGNVTQNQEEIDLCLNCPYDDCVSHCKRLKNFREERKKNNG